VATYGLLWTPGRECTACVYLCVLYGADAGREGWEGERATGADV
jgi:hypothetical protein